MFPSSRSLSPLSFAYIFAPSFCLKFASGISLFYSFFFYLRLDCLYTKLGSLSYSIFLLGTILSWVSISATNSSWLLSFLSGLRTSRDSCSCGSEILWFFFLNLSVGCLSSPLSILTSFLLTYRLYLLFLSLIKPSTISYSISLDWPISYEVWLSS